MTQPGYPRLESHLLILLHPKITLAIFSLVHLRKISFELQTLSSGLSIQMELNKGVFATP